MNRRLDPKFVAYDWSLGYEIRSYDKTEFETLM